VRGTFLKNDMQAGDINVAGPPCSALAAEITINMFHRSRATTGVVKASSKMIEPLVVGTVAK